eukprot:g32922.t1
MKMKGFWPAQDNFPMSQTMKIDGQETTEALLREAMEVQPLVEQNVSEDHVTLFALTQRKTRQMRFKHLPLDDALKCHIQSAALDPQISILVMVSQGYDPQTLETSSQETEDVFHALSEWTEELILLIVKYFCPVKQVIVTLGCYYSQLSEPLKVQAIELHPKSTTSEEATLAGDATPGGLLAVTATATLCATRGGSRSTSKHAVAPTQEIKPRDIEKTMKEEGLYCGDVVIWQPQSAAGPRRPGEGGASEAPEDGRFLP